MYVFSDDEVGIGVGRIDFLGEMCAKRHGAGPEITGMERNVAAGQGKVAKPCSSLI